MQGQLTNEHAPAFIIVFISVWEQAYTQDNPPPSTHRTHWLGLAAPLLLELLGFFFSHNVVQRYISDRLPFITLSIVKACRTSFSCIPVRNCCSVSDSTVQGIQKWLLQHPMELRGLVAPLTSTGVRWFLWAAAAALAEGSFIPARTDVLAVPKDELQADHEGLSRLPYQDMMTALAGTGAKTFGVFYGELLSCLSHLYLVFPAEHALGRMIGVGSEETHGANHHQQQQEQQQQEHHLCISSESCSSSSSRDSRSSSSRTTCSSSGDGKEGLGRREGTGSSRDERAGVRMQQEASGNVREGCPSSHAMEELAAAAVAAAAYAPSVRGHAPPATPADMHWLLSSLPYPSFGASSATAGGGAEAAVPTGAAAAPEIATGIAAERAVPAPGCSGEPMLGVQGWYPAPPTLPHLLLVLELALLTWRAVGKAGPNDECWRCLLLLVGLLQQSSVEVRQQLMEQRGSLLLQLLYHVLREDTGLGGDGMFSSTIRPFGVVSEAIAQDVVQKISDLERKGGDDCSKQVVAEIIAAEQCHPSVHLVVLMALQSLMYELLPLESEGVLVEQIGGMITLNRGERCIYNGARIT